MRAVSSLDIILSPDLPMPFALGFVVVFVVFCFVFSYIFKRIYYKELLLRFITQPSRKRQPSFKMGCYFPPLSLSFFFLSS